MGNKLKSKLISFDFESSEYNKMLRLPCNVFFTDLDMNVLNCNEVQAKAHGAVSVEDTINRSLYTFLTKETCAKIKANNLLVERSRSIQIFEEHIERVDSVTQLYLSVKFPLYDDACKTVIGSFGLGIDISTRNLNIATEILSKLNCPQLPTSSNELQKTLGGSEVDGVHLSHKETLCLYYTIHGKTAKEIAKKLLVSYRTVEVHLSHIKEKLGCHSKSELIDKALNKGFYSAIK